MSIMLKYIIAFRNMVFWHLFAYLVCFYPKTEFLCATSLAVLGLTALEEPSLRGERGLKIGKA